MPIQLDKILSDVAVEKVLHINYPEPVPKKDIENAWLRVGKKNNLSVHEVRSIFKVLQKKYEQERVKERSGWKLFPIMDEIHQTSKLDSVDEDALPMEEDEEYEMLEVQEEEEQQAMGSSAHSPESDNSDNESSTKWIKTEVESGSPESYDKQSTATATVTSSTTTITTGTSPREEKKLLNSLISPNSRIHSSTAAALQKKGITVKKTTSNGMNKKIITNASPQQNKSISSNGHQLLTIGKTIQLPEALKRKLTEDSGPSPMTKKTLLGQTVSPKLSVLKNETERATTASNSDAANGTTATSHHGISLITIPANDASASLTVNGTSAATVSDPSNGASSPCLDDTDFRNNIIFDTSMTGDRTLNGGSELPGARKPGSNNDEQILELGGSDNILPRTFFKNLCNSTRYESLGLYVANAMNRLDQRAANRLELTILRAIIDAQNDALGNS